MQGVCSMINQETSNGNPNAFQLRHLTVLVLYYNTKTVKDGLQKWYISALLLPVFKIEIK